MMTSKLTKKDYYKTALRSYFLQNGFNYGTYQGISYANVIRPALRKIHPDDEAFKKSMLDNIEFYNTNPQLVPFITSVQLVMTESQIEDTEIRSMKMALMGPLAGIGDSLSQFLLAPLLSTIFATMASQGNSLAPVLFFITINAILIAVKLLSGKAGYETGVKMIDTLSDQMSRVTQAASIVGVTVIAALSTQLVKIYLPFTYIQKISGKEQVVSVQKMLDGMAPKLLPVIYTVFIYWLVKKKKLNTYQVVIITVILAILGSMLGIISPINPLEP